LRRNFLAHLWIVFIISSLFILFPQLKKPPGLVARFLEVVVGKRDLPSFSGSMFYGAWTKQKPPDQVALNSNDLIPSSIVGLPGSGKLKHKS
jgi:hypothetical protein